ncbi:MAG TPA: hypothetical protein IAB94_02770 [Candidatus Coproplasma avicola]|uniref:Uncharacterized protein n=1 Tax=Candidatus Coproplasma avicola TaxID=2840744 RepID=A0A9D1E5Q7_9FIRM|nr:hypothetical protein [Candidatus Coproplasma avicola]
MKSKLLVCGALAAAITMSVALPACVTRDEEDLNQVIATVDITKSENLEAEGLSEYASAISSENITKRDLIAAYYNTASSLSSSYSTSEIFELLVNTLTNTAVVVQYTTLSLIKDKVAEDASFLSEYQALSSDVEKYELLLEGETSTNDDGGESDRVMLAQYALYSSINSSLDSQEESIINGDDQTSEVTETRTTPGGAGEEVENFLPLNDDGTLNYNIYTGYTGDGYSYLLEDSGAYADDALEGSTRSTRRLAYAQFITSLRDNYLLSEEEDVRDIMSVSYIQEEYLSQLQQQAINEYYERYQAEQEALIESVDENGVYTFLQNHYLSDLTDQTVSNSTASAFETSMSSLSDTSFILYAPATEGTDGGTYGYVYNILLPFSASQSVNIDSSDTSAQYYFERKDILTGITATDQRSAWFNGATDYSFDVSQSDIDYYGKNDGRDYLFFEDNLTKPDRYASLDKYAGLYSYNGRVSENTDGTYNLVPNKVDIDGFLTELENYVEYIMGGDTVSIQKEDSYNVSSYTDYYTEETADLEDESQRKIDYSRFVYATGKVDVGLDDTDLSSFLSTMFVEDSAAYKAMSAVNELQFAYTTDTGILSNYIGYSISAYETKYIPEFEYAAQTAINEGAGTIYVCAGDYGWHVIYVTATFDTAGGAVYGEDIAWTADEVLTEGTFQNLYYTWIKDSTLTNVTTNRRSVINERFGGDSTITKYEDAYRDLLEIEDSSSSGSSSNS